MKGETYEIKLVNLASELIYCAKSRSWNDTYELIEELNRLNQPKIREKIIE